MRPICEYTLSDPPLNLSASSAPIMDKGSTVQYVDTEGVKYVSPPGEVRASIRQSELLSVFAQVSKTFHEVLQVYRQKQADALVALFIELSPGEALELMNISNYDPEDWTAVPDTSLLTYDVVLGSRLQVVIWLKRSRVKDSTTAEQELLVQCGVAERTDGRPSLSPELSVLPHELCSKSASLFEYEDNDIYDAWHQTTRSDLHAWLTGQFTALSEGERERE